MKTLTGAPVPPEDVIGRDGLILRLWDVLERQSVLLTAERRIGKTSVIRKMHAENGGRLTYYSDLEKCATAAEFAGLIYADVEKQLSGRKKAAEKTRQLLKRVAEIELKTPVGGFKLPAAAEPYWKDIISHSIEDLIQNTEGPVIFFWDEMPWMIDCIAQREGENTAMQVLDLLRELRQTHPAQLRMVITGSIGMHHILASLKTKGYRNAPLNDLNDIEVPPLAPADSRLLAAKLLDGNGVQTGDADLMAQTIAEEVDHFAFYIQLVVDRLSLNEGTQSPDDARGIVADLLVDAQDPWEMNHFSERLTSYYHGEAGLARQILDAVAVAGQPVKATSIIQTLQSQGAVDADRVRELLKLLAADYYLQTTRDKSYSFRYGLILRWWRLDRDL